MAIFSMLFGASTMLYINSIKRNKKRPLLLFYSRNFWLLILGWIHASYLWYGDVLFIYSLCSFALFFFIGVTPKNQFILGCLIYFLPTFSNYALYDFVIDHLDQAEKDVIIQHWNPPNEVLQQEINAYRGSYKDQIQHRAVKTLLKHLKIKDGMEIHYDGDLPARSGMGSSSCFAVGLIKALYKIKNKDLSKNELARKTIHFEQKIMKEVVGSQDQTITSYGGFNKIIFSKNNKIQVQKISFNKNIRSLNKNLVLIYTGINRTAHKIANTYVKKLTKSKKYQIEKIMSYVNEGKKILESGNVDDFGRLLNNSWHEKKSLSNLITNKKIDELYDEAIRYGALGGKLLGAGGGGFLLMYMSKENAKKFFKRHKSIINIPFNFTKDGSQIILNNI